MRTVLISILCAIPGLLAASESSPYAGQEQRHIKALSAQEIAAYARGDGMGMARAAELNHYPGPKHVLQLAAQLDLSKAQYALTAATFDDMQARASALGQQLIAAEIELDREFSHQTVDEQRLKGLIIRIGQINSELRYTHLVAHLKQRNILAPEQVEKYAELRGYTAGVPRHVEHAGQH